MQQRNLNHDVQKRLGEAYTKHGRAPWSRHEFYAILLEEFDQLWQTIKSNEPFERFMDELIDVAAVLQRHCDTTTEQHNPTS